MVDAGVLSLDQIPTHIKLTEIQQAQVDAYRFGKTVIRMEEIRGELAKLSFPLYFIDYETYPSAIPLFDGFVPYDHIPLQYSLHVLESPEDVPLHKQFLHLNARDPSPAFVAGLQRDVGPAGSVIVWNRSFEPKINEGIAQRIPTACGFIAELNARVYDLKDIFSKQYYVDRNLWGKVSLKNVLPVLVPEANYSGLEIQEGGAASVAWKKLLSGELRNEERERLLSQLSLYCERDSHAMYAIWRALRHLVGG